jgi:hypothetical protein
VARAWPAGLHLAAGSLPAVGQRPRRPASTPQRHYWRETETELHASATVQPRLLFLDKMNLFAASVGPTAAGENWYVSMVQVQTDVGYAAPPLIAQQITGQLTGQTTFPPPPVAAQVWLSVAGTNLHLLAQSSQGSYDNIGVGGQQVRPGEQITVQWWVPEPFVGDAGLVQKAWFILRGTRRALSQI